MAFQRRERSGTFGNFMSGWGNNQFSQIPMDSELFPHAVMMPPPPPMPPAAPGFQLNLPQLGQERMFGGLNFGGSQSYGLGDYGNRLSADGNLIPNAASGTGPSRGTSFRDLQLEAAQSQPQVPPGAGGGNQGGFSWTNHALPWMELGMKGIIGAGQLGLGFAGLNEARIHGRAARRLANQNYAASVRAYNNALRDRLEGRGGLSKEEIERQYQRSRQR